MKILILVLGLWASVSFSQSLTCTAKVTIRRYQVSLDTESKAMKVTTDNGFIYDGQSIYHYSPFMRYHTYTLPGSYYNSQLVILMDPKQGNAMALCLQQSECYSCN